MRRRWPDGVFAGSTGSLGFPTRGLVAPPVGGGMAWVARLNANLSDLVFGSYLGEETFGGAAGAAPDGSGEIVSVITSGRDLDTHIMLVRTEERERGSAPRIDAVLNEASVLGGPIAPGERLLIRGAGLGTDAHVLFGDAEAQVLGSTAGRLIVRAPALPDTGSVPLHIVTPTGTSESLSTPVSPYAPAIYTSDGSGHGQALVLHEDGSRNTVSNPAPRGSVVTVLVNGVEPLRIDGESVVLPDPLQVHIAGVRATTVEAHLLAVPALNGTVLSLNVRVPELSDGALPQGPAATGISLMVRNFWTINQYPLTMWIK